MTTRRALLGATGPLDADTPRWLAPHVPRRPRQADSAALLAAGKQHNTAVVVAVPDDNDPVHRLSAHPHVTLCFLGEAAGLTAEDRTDVEELVRVLGAGLGPFDVAVNGSGVLGAHDQPVLLVESEPLARLHQLLADEPVIAELTDLVEQHPNWIPHVSIRDDVTARQIAQVRSVRIAALGVWWGGSKVTVPLTGRDRGEPTYAPDDDETAQREELRQVVASGMSIPAVHDLRTLRVCVAYAQTHENARWYATKRAAALGLLAEVPHEWTVGTVVHNDRTSVRLTDNGPEPVVPVVARRTAEDDEPDAYKLRVTPEGAAALHRAAFPAAYRTGKIHGRGRR